MKPLHRRPRGADRVFRRLLPLNSRVANPFSHNLQSQFGRRTRYVRAGQTTEKSKAMIRLASLLALMGALWAGAAQAQHSEADLVTRIDRLQAQVRELTGTVEELQYRNQQLEQEVQRLRGAGANAHHACQRDRCR